MLWARRDIEACQNDDSAGDARRRAKEDRNLRWRGFVYKKARLAR